MDFRAKLPALSARYISATQRPRTSFAWIYAIRSLVVLILLIAGAGVGHAQCPPSSSGSGNTGDVLYNNGTSTGCNNSSVTIDSTGKNVTVPGTLTFLNSSSKNAYANLSFSNFAALKAFDPTSLGSNMVSATTAGYSAPGDGGGSTYDWVASPPSNIVTDTYFYVIKPTGATGVWVLRMDAGGLRPEQAGAKCDAAAAAAATPPTVPTDDSAAFNNITTVFTNAVPKVYSPRIALTPGHQCYLSNSSWTLPYGATVDGGYTPNQRGLNGYTSGFLLAPTAPLIMEYSSTIQNLIVYRYEQPFLKGPMKYSEVAAEIAKWGAEHGAQSSISVVSGYQGSGCQVGDVLVIGPENENASTGYGTEAVVQVTALTDDGMGGVKSFNILRSGAYYILPPPPTLAATVTARATLLGVNCTTLPQFTISFAGATPRSVGIVEKQDDSINNVMVIGFNVAVVATEQSASFHKLYFDDYNGVDVSGVGDSAFYSDSHGIAYWSAAVLPSVSQGAYSVVGYPVVGSGYTQGAMYQLMPNSPGTCSEPIKVTVNVNGSGNITSASLTDVGTCNNVTNPVPVQVPGGTGTQAQLTLQLVTSDFRPGVAYSFHDQCDGCAANNLSEHGWLTGTYLSNVWSMNIDNLGLECGSGYGSYGLLVQNASSGILSHVHVGGCQYPLKLDGAPKSEPNNTYPYIPPYAPSANRSTNIVIYGGETTCDGNSADGDKCPYLVHAGDSSSGMLFGFNLGSNNNLSYCTEGPASTYCPVLIEAPSDPAAFWTIRNLLGTASGPLINTPGQASSDYGSVSCSTINLSSFTVTNGFVTHC